MEETRSIVVTGSSRGWGKATALKFARPGTRVFVNYVQNDAMAKQTVEEVEARGAAAFAVKADMGTEAGIEDLFTQVRAECDRLDVLVYNAFSHINGPPLSVSFEDLERCMDVGPYALLRSVRHAVPLMEGGGGRIICTGSVATQRLFSMTGTGYFPMAVAKGAEEVMIKYLAVELGPKNITANMVVAGWIDTEYVVDTFAEERRSRIYRRTPLGRFATSEEMANVVHFLGSPEGSWVTGQIITADGGLTVV